MGMAIEDETQTIPDAIGVRSYFATIFYAEPAGDGCVRVYGCAKVNGRIETQYIVVIPARCMLEGQAVVRQTAVAVMHEGESAVH